jgi:hypothetical protein
MEGRTRSRAKLTDLYHVVLAWEQARGYKGGCNAWQDWTPQCRIIGQPRVPSPHLRFCCQLSTELDSGNEGHAATYIDIRSMQQTINLKLLP